MDIDLLIINFIKKFFFILKAASEGWRVKYIGGNKFRFHTTHYILYTKSKCLNSREFVEKYLYI
jgi:hypothetical protein